MDEKTDLSYRPEYEQKKATKSPQHNNIKNKLSLEEY
jgi:hypothetical protein